MCRAFLHRIPLLPFPFGHASILAVFSLRFSHHGNLPGTITLWALRSLELRSTYRAVFSGHCHSLWGETGTAHISLERPGNWWNRPGSNWWPPDPKSGALPTALRLHIGGRWRCRSPRLSPRTVFETGSEAARIHLPDWLEVLHHAQSGVEPDRLGTRTPLHLQG